MLFKRPLVRAILAGRKTVTRRLLGRLNTLVDGGPWPKGWQFDLASARLDKGPSPAGNQGPYLVAKRIGADTLHRLYPRVAPGDLVCVRESLRRDRDRNVWTYAADGADVQLPATDERVGAMAAWAHHKTGDHCAGIHMPRWACRLTRPVVASGFERLQAITGEEACAEGAFFTDYGFWCHHGWDGPGPCPAPPEHHTQKPGWSMVETSSSDECLSTARMAFANAWESIHGDQPGASWGENTWICRTAWGTA